MQGPDSSTKNMQTRIFELFCRSKASPQEEDGAFRLSTGFLEHCPVTLPLANQRKATHPAGLTPNFAYNNRPPPKKIPIREFRVLKHESPVFLVLVPLK